MKRRQFITLVSGAATLWSPSLLAQEAQSAFQVGFLYPGTQAGATPRVVAYRSGLRAGGIPADKVSVIVRAADGDLRSLGMLAADLVSRKVDLIHAAGPAAVRAAKAATTTIPIVVGDLESDPVAAGFIVSYARPGGNITGMFLDFPDFSKKWLESLKEAVPKATTVAVIWDPATGQTQLRAIETIAPTLGFTKLDLVINVKTAKEFGLTVPPSLIARADKVIE